MTLELIYNNVYTIQMLVWTEYQLHYVANISDYLRLSKTVKMHIQVN